MKRILCPIDFSEASLNALEHAVQMGITMSASLTLIYVFDEEEFITVVQEADTNDTKILQTLAEKKLRECKQQILETEGAEKLKKVDYILRVGDLVHSIVDYAERHQTQLIVMGTTGAGSLGEVYVGSNTVKVFQSAQCPVLCVPGDAPYAPIRKLIYATDYDRDDQEYLKIILAMAQELQAKVEVLHIDGHDSESRQEEYSSYAKELSTFFGSKALSFHRKICNDTVEQCLDVYLNESGAEIMALLTRNRGYLEKLFSHSVVKNLSYFTDSPLLIFKN